MRACVRIKCQSETRNCLTHQNIVIDNIKAGLDNMNVIPEFYIITGRKKSKLLKAFLFCWILIECRSSTTIVVTNASYSNRKI